MKSTFKELHYPTLDRALKVWFYQARAKNMHINTFNCNTVVNRIKRLYNICLFRLNCIPFLNHSLSQQFTIL